VSAIGRRGVDAFPLTGRSWRDRFTPLQTVADLVGKRWMEGAVPLVLAALLTLGVLLTTPVGWSDSSLIMEEVAEKGFIAIGLTIVIVAGGMDLSVGSMVGVVSIGTMTAFRIWDWPMGVVIPVAVLAGAVLGAINGLLIAVFKMRPFITTLVTLVAFGGAAAALQSANTNELAFPKTSFTWEFLGEGAIAGIPTAWALFAVVLVVAHLGLTRSRWGWWVTAVGSDRRSARRKGIPVAKVLFCTYVLSGMLAGTAGLLTATRLGRTDPNVGQGWELIALTAVVIGGVSLKGGRGSVVRAIVGVFVVAVILQAGITMTVSAGVSTALLALVLLIFAILDLKWGKYRGRFAEKLSIDPGRITTGPLLDVNEPGSVWSINSRLTDAPPIGLDVVEGAEDCAIDDDGNLYCGDRRGWIWRFRGPDLEHGEVFARTGGMPLGHAWDPDGNLVVAVGGMGVYRVMPDGSTELVANKVRRSWGSLHDDSALRFADDIDMAPDGSIYVSDFSTRTNAAEYMIELVEYRPNGRLIRVDPDGSTDVVVSNYVFPNGVCTAHDGQSVLVASTGLFRVDRLWITGPKQGQLEPVLENLPGYCDNVNRASDGNYWMSFIAMRTPMSDLLMKYPAVRRRMTRETPQDNWLVPQLNVSCVLKFNDQGEVLKVLWDASLENYPMVTSINEHDGYLYLCGLLNNRIGRLRLDPDEVGTIDPRAVPGLSTPARPFAGVAG
jgi:ribose transport system permease protein